MLSYMQMEMIKRNFWLTEIERAWQKRSVIWLSGVRRVGKTCLSQNLRGVEYFDCELPRTRRMMEDAEEFLEGLKNQDKSVVVLDEIHRLNDPAQLLKIAADHYPKIKILATGSSTLGASFKFKDTLSGRKKEIWLTPAISEDLADFAVKDLKWRLLRGGLPPFLLSKKFPEADFQEWIDAYWAKDIQELFRLERKYSFQKFIELIMAQSGSIFEATRFTAPCEVSRTTITNYLKVLEETFVAHIIRPFSHHRPTEIISAPKVYGFDTGFVCYYRGWHELREQDLGILWEHYVLNEIQAKLHMRTIHYWRDKRGHEVDFIIPRRGKPIVPIAIECKWKCKQFDDRGLKAFFYQYPKAKFFVLAQDVDREFSKKVGEVQVTFTNLPGMIEHLKVVLNTDVE